jgi:hypothetical protein
MYIEVEKNEKILKFLKGKEWERWTYIYESRVAPLKPPKESCIEFVNYFLLIDYGKITLCKSVVI